MQSLTIQMSQRIDDDDLVAEIEKQSVYVARGLRQVRVSEDRSQVLASFEGQPPEEIRDRVTRFLESMIRGFRPVDQKVIGRTERRDRRPYETGVFGKLVDKGWVLDLGPGQAALGGPALALARFLEQRIAAIGRARFGAVEREYPTLIPAEVLARCGYTSSFPQHLSMVTHLAEDFESIEAFRKANVDRRDVLIPDAAAFSPPRVCLCPALCYHCYPLFEKKQLPREGHTETAIGRIARYESSSMVGLERLWDFTQRSIIWLGDEGFCNVRRDWALEVALDLARTWDIDCTIETANDPFFASISTAKSFWQRAQDLKYEMRAPIEPDAGGRRRTLAVASFNLHGAYFGHAFEIMDHAGEPVCSGCASWGLERLVLVIFTQHGLDPATWPPALREAVSA